MFIIAGVSEKSNSAKGRSGNDITDYGQTLKRV